MRVMLAKPSRLLSDGGAPQVVFWSRGGAEVRTSRLDDCQATWFTHHDGQHGYEYTLSIPQHNELGPGLLRKLIRQADLTVEAFNSL